jgi:hypothetical protein
MFKVSDIIDHGQFGNIKFKITKVYDIYHNSSRYYDIVDCNSNILYRQICGRSFNLISSKLNKQPNLPGWF